jgi:hypothetical protein
VIPPQKLIVRSDEPRGIVGTDYSTNAKLVSEQSFKDNQRTVGVNHQWMRWMIDVGLD